MDADTVEVVACEIVSVVLGPRKVEPNVSEEVIGTFGAEGLTAAPQTGENVSVTENDTDAVTNPFSVVLVIVQPVGVLKASDAGTETPGAIPGALKVQID